MLLSIHIYIIYIYVYKIYMIYIVILYISFEGFGAATFFIVVQATCKSDKSSQETKRPPAPTIKIYMKPPAGSKVLLTSGMLTFTYPRLNCDEECNA